MVKVIGIYSCGECPYYKTLADRFGESSIYCQKLKRFVDKSSIDPDCPLDDLEDS